MTLLALGVPGSGKSRYLGRLLASRLADPRARAFVFCPNRTSIARMPEPLGRVPWYASGARLDADGAAGKLPRLTVAFRAEDVPALARQAARHRPCILWLDEIVDVANAQRFTVDTLRLTWGKFRHLGVELWVAAHRPSDCPRVVTAHADTVLIFRLEEPSDLRYVAGRYGSAYAHPTGKRDLSACALQSSPTWTPLLWSRAPLDTAKAMLIS